MKYGSVCSGLGGDHLASKDLGWYCSFFSEIDDFASELLKQHYPSVPNHGDFTKITNELTGDVDLLIGGTPCQSFSVAGKRGGMEDERGNLAIEFIRLASRLNARWIVWENVPGVLSSNKGKDFETFLNTMEEFGYFGSWRTLDAQYFGVSQRRRRVFFVGCLGNWRAPAAVLFESESLRGNYPKIEGTRKENTRSNPNTPRRTSQVVPTITASYSTHYGKTAGANGGLSHAVLVNPVKSGVARCLTSRQGRNDPNFENFVAITQNSKNVVRFVGGDGKIVGALAASTGTGKQQPFILGTKIRRLTPLECKRLQGLPDNYTKISWMGKAHGKCPDTRRYKAIGNGFAIPVMAWILKRLDAVDKLLFQQRKR